MPAEELDGDIPLLLADGAVDEGEFRGAQGDVAGDEEEIDFSVADGVLEPWFLDGVGDFFDNGVVAIACEVEEETEGQDADALVFGGEFFVARGERALLACFGVDEVEIGGDVVSLKVGDCFVVLSRGGVGLVELVVPGADDIDVLFGEYTSGEFTLGSGCIIESVAFYSVSSVHEKNVNPVLVRSFVQSLSEGDVVAPVGAEGGSGCILAKAASSERRAHSCKCPACQPWVSVVCKKFS